MQISDIDGKGNASVEGVEKGGGGVFVEGKGPGRWCVCWKGVRREGMCVCERGGQLGQVAALSVCARV